MQERSLRDLVDELPTESLELYVQHYEAGEVGGYSAHAFPPAASLYHRDLYCPRCSMGFAPTVGSLSVVTEETRARLRPFAIHRDHPAWLIEEKALCGRLDTAALYDECVMAIAERDAATTDLPEPDTALVGGVET